MSGRGANVILFIAALVIARSAWAQSFTPDPGSWRPVAYTDLMFPLGEAEVYASIWQDRLDESKRRLASKAPEPNHRDMSLAVGNRAAKVPLVSGYGRGPTCRIRIERCLQARK